MKKDTVAAKTLGQTVPRIDGDRLWANIETTAHFGAMGQTGLKRLTLTEEDRKVRDWFVAECRTLGCSVEWDQIGNMFATYPGQNMALAPIAVGSHLDTQPGGGRFDGILGVLSGIEVVRALRAASHVLKHPVTVVNWTNEEGSRFPPAMMGSGVFCGVHDLSRIEAVQDKSGVSVSEALMAIGYQGEQATGHKRFSAYLELHVEQGPILEAENVQIGAVTGIQGVSWLDIEVTGVEAHAGSYPMGMREDALLLASRIILAVEAIAASHPPGVATVGFIRAEPNSRNVVPGKVALEVDLRHPDDATLSDMENLLIAEVQRVAPRNDIRAIWRKTPATFNGELVKLVHDQAESLGYNVINMVSGAGHDAGHLAGVSPTAMIFIPSRDGLSHNVQEYSSPQQCAQGAQVLLHTVIEIDRLFSGNNQT